MRRLLAFSLLVLLAVMLAGPAQATATCPSYGSYTTYCTSGGGYGWSNFYWDCGSCCTDRAREQPVTVMNHQRRPARDRPRRTN